MRVDQDALDFLKAFGAFSVPHAPAPVATAPEPEFYFRMWPVVAEYAHVLMDCPEHVEVFPVMLKLDYKPKRVDYKALKEGRTIELMNFFHFDGAEMTLRQITLHGVCFL